MEAEVEIVLPAETHHLIGGAPLGRAILALGGVALACVDGHGGVEVVLDDLQVFLAIGVALVFGAMVEHLAGQRGAEMEFVAELGHLHRRARGRMNHQRAHANVGDAPLELRIILPGRARSHHHKQNHGESARLSHRQLLQ